LYISRVQSYRARKTLPKIHPNRLRGAVNIKPVANGWIVPSIINDANCGSSLLNVTGPVIRIKTKAIENKVEINHAFKACSTSSRREEANVAMRRIHRNQIGGAP
jgi:hypothetical protein